MNTETEMKRFILLAGFDTFCKSGFLDLEGSFETLDEAFQFCKKGSGSGYSWAHILDTKTGECWKRTFDDKIAPLVGK